MPGWFFVRHEVPSKTLHYTFSQVSSEQAWAKIYGAGSDLDILLKKLDVDLWLAEKDRWPVRIDIRTAAESAAMVVSHEWTCCWTLETRTAPTYGLSPHSSSTAVKR